LRLRGAVGATHQPLHHLCALGHKHSACLLRGIATSY
jgi:hypothetical protein